MKRIYVLHRSVSALNLLDKLELDKLTREDKNSLKSELMVHIKKLEEPDLRDEPDTIQELINLSNSIK